MDFSLRVRPDCAQGLVAVDTLGVMLGWQFIDHWAHLGGTGIGWLYATYGREQIWESVELRSWLLKQRAEVRRILTLR